MEPMNSRDVLPKNVPGCGWGGVDHVGVRWGGVGCLWYGRMVKALACRVEGPGFESHHGKKFRLKSFGKKKRGQLSSACMMEVQMTGVLPNS